MKHVYESHASSPFHSWNADAAFITLDKTVRSKAKVSCPLWQAAQIYCLMCDALSSSREGWTITLQKNSSIYSELRMNQNCRETLGPKGSQMQFAAHKWGNLSVTDTVGALTLILFYSQSTVRPIGQTLQAEALLRKFWTGHIRCYLNTVTLKTRLRTGMPGLTNAPQIIGIPGERLAREAIY